MKHESMTGPVIFFMFLITWILLAVFIMFSQINIPDTVYFIGTDHGSGEPFSGQIMLGE